ncbi:hypothetical protein BABINDRAFT_161357 [Babjeviella inositovora NRRL Y-12698]|uniref:Globin family profile domain-containing protein n=1 Tax=Babjeviella inositovora NRRL Y-12698 TaxID=984486 RepID=A0A1E3QRV3_9ASCO|nr:uncharacterized protein BABINDRAFT_161357 [Babjeviella inositovora NRRL Y-12698]ODQ80411.1 hypothetical protein BABINDRAFT_161357 [Babjeviella inositovora NRRL Y-12698]
MSTGDYLSRKLSVASDSSSNSDESIFEESRVTRTISRDTIASVSSSVYSTAPSHAKFQTRSVQKAKSGSHSDNASVLAFTAIPSRQVPSYSVPAKAKDRDQSYWKFVHTKFSPYEVKMLNDAWFTKFGKNQNTGSLKAHLSSIQFWHHVYNSHLDSAVHNSFFSTTKAHTFEQILAQLPPPAHQRIAISSILSLCMGHIKHLSVVQGKLVNLGRLHKRVFLASEEIHERKAVHIPGELDFSATHSTPGFNPASLEILGAAVLLGIKELYHNPGLEVLKAAEELNSKEEAELFAFMTAFSKLWGFITESMMLGIKLDYDHLAPTEMQYSEPGKKSVEPAAVDNHFTLNIDDFNARLQKQFGSGTEQRKPGTFVFPAPVHPSSEAAVRRKASVFSFLRGKEDDTLPSQRASKTRDLHLDRQAASVRKYSKNL